ncbi:MULTISPECIES: hypothetical protein [Micromonospora]|uniref:Uncharacterized protein n=1 Tax=Micromonospora sicca TaxID=2202420 RepID=A0A317DPW8_9ACTN|nr:MULTISPECIES: hypothetical protein [unclassified Micromonospora]MBM0229760.1 hypothetical protein [Micromonospora sp. ATA51]PWR16140.1 hypothetical protein DKT69_07225 [Micromonospora sp. 4G51]
MSGNTAIRTAALVTLTALTGACQSTGEGTAAPAGTTAPAPSASAAAIGTTAAPSPVTAANTAAVCASVDKLIIAGSREIADDSAAATRQEFTPEQVNAQLKANLTELADDVRGQAARAQDPEIKALITDTADRIDAGARSAAPVKWLTSTFVGIPRRLTDECHA